MTKKVRLVSDFKDSYDHWFDREGIEFRRMTTDGPNRIEMFQILNDHGFDTPKNGLDFDDFVPNGGKFISYLNLRDHRGEGKKLVTCTPEYEKAILFGQYFAEYLEPDLTVDLDMGSAWRETTSFRCLVIGLHRTFWLKYTSDDAWRSNVGDVCIEPRFVEMTHRPYQVGVLGPKTERLAESMRLPLLAIDFVCHRGVLYAVDLNVAPGLPDTEILGFSNDAVASFIKDAVVRYDGESKHRSA